MAAAAAPSLSVGLPEGPSASPWALAFRYTYRFPAATREWHARFGPSYTLRLPGLEPSVITTDRELIHHLVTGEPGRRRHANDILEPALGSRSVMLLEPDAHLRRRRLLLPPFHGERVKAYAQLMRELVEAELDSWADGEPVAVHERARALTLSVIERAVLGSSDPAFRAELGALVDTFNSPLANFGLFAPTISKRARWNLLAEPFHRNRDRLDALMARQVARVRDDPQLEERGDVLALLLLARDEDGEGLGDEDLLDELKTLLIAGHETTATAIGWAADVLAHDPAAARRVREGDRAYLSAAAKEVLRIRTVAPISVARTLLDPVVAGDGELPAGTVVLADAFSLHGIRSCGRTRRRSGPSASSPATARRRTPTCRSAPGRTAASARRWRRSSSRRRSRGCCGASSSSRSAGPRSRAGAARRSSLPRARPCACTRSARHGDVG